jgi:putative nucleotidyltransferase with HDIG domain
MQVPGLRINAAFLRTKVARRVLALFIICALVPIGLMFVISYRTVSSQLHQQSRARISQTSKSMADGVMERLQFLDAKLGIVTSTLRDRSLAEAIAALNSDDSLRFSWMTLVTGDTTIQLLRDGVSVPSLDDQLRDNLARGSSSLVVDTSQADAIVLLVRAVDPKQPERGRVWTELSGSYLFGGRDGTALPSNMEMCIFDRELHPLYCSIPVEPLVLEGMGPAYTPNTDRSDFDWHGMGEKWLASYRSVFLRAEYSAPKWVLTLSEKDSQALQPMTGFRQWFLPVTLLALWIVMLLSNIQIRKSMEPLVELKEGTRRIAQRDFESTVKVSSGDEFEDLAASFNNMAYRLGQQFNALTAINEIDRAVLSAFDTDVIIDTMLGRTRDVLACDGISVGVSSSNSTDPEWTTVAVDASNGLRVVKEVTPVASELQELIDNPKYLMTNGSGPRRSYLELEPFVAHDLRHFLVLPVFIKRELAGVIALGHRVKREYDDDDLVQARQLADQVAVALSNTRLIEELEELKIGALTALARTIDAKSPWTAGHSERVTKMALEVGNQMGLSEEQLEIINRGGLLHDIGKLGIPPEILDKPGRLTEEEFAVIRQHPEIGARILQPVTAYASVIPMVLHHHEKWDGSGYPQGLAGTDIPFTARLLTVPDVFDAVTSERPYRSGMTYEDASNLIVRAAGTEFDVEVVEAFKEVMKRKIAERDRVPAAAPQAAEV